MSKFKRDPKTALSRLTETKDGKVLVRAPCYIQVPERWMGLGIGLGSVTEKTMVYGFFPIVFNDGIYTVMNVCALMEITPSRTTKVTVNDQTYYEFHFDADTSIIKSLNVVRQDTLTFNIFNEFFMKGKVPWWATLDDLASIFDTANQFAGSKMGQTPQTIEFIAGVITRRKDETTKSIRQSAKNFNDYDLDNIEFVPLNSVLHSVNNTVSKLSGSYFHEGVISAIVNPSNRASQVEKILRT